jgi:hypothetical protein
VSAGCCRRSHSLLLRDDRILEGERLAAERNLVLIVGETHGQWDRARRRSAAPQEARQLSVQARVDERPALTNGDAGCGREGPGGGSYHRIVTGPLNPPSTVMVRLHGTEAIASIPFGVRAAVM